MKTTTSTLVKTSLLAFVGLITASASPLSAQEDLVVTIDGSFSSAKRISSCSTWLIDNDLTNGYRSGFDNFQGPAIENTIGAAAIQWGKKAGPSAFPHTSALWFEPEAVINPLPNEDILLGSLFYRNGTIWDRTGISAVDLDLAFNFNQSSGIPNQSLTYNLSLINTLNTRDPIASADIVRFNNYTDPVWFTDDFGNTYFVELSLRVDNTTLANTLSAPNEFRVLEGGTGRAELVARYSMVPVPEPGSAVLLGLSAMFLLNRRRRRA